MSPQARKRFHKILNAFKKALWFDKSIDAMTSRARIYFATGGGRHGFTGLTILFLPWLYASAVFVPIFNLLSLTAWGWIMALVGFCCCWAAVNKNADLARVGIVLSAMVTSVMALGLWIGISFVWYGWFQSVGADMFWTVFVDRPKSYPEHLRAITSIVPPSPFLPLVMTALVIKDFTMCAQPLRVPLEERKGELLPMGG